MTTMEVNHEGSLLERFARKMEVENESNSDHSSFLTNKDLLPVPYEKRTWTAWTCELCTQMSVASIADSEKIDALFWFGECASVTSWTVASTGVKSGLVCSSKEIVVIKTHCKVVMVGVLDMCYHRSFYRCLAYGLWRSSRSCLSRPIPDHHKSQFWSLGKLLANLQQECYDRHLDWRAGSDHRQLHLRHAPRDLPVYCKSS